jgi:hypothetical protein
MPLTAEHQQAPLFRPAQLRELVTGKTFQQIMQLPMMERAEVLDYLLEAGATVRMKADQEQDIPFSVVDPYRRMEPETDEPVAFHFAIPGGKKAPKELPLRAAIHVYSCLDQPQFGGSTWTGGEIRDDGNLSPVKRAPGNPKLISFELVQGASLSGAE